MKMKKIMPIVLIVVLAGGASAAGGYFYSQDQSKKKVDESKNQIREKEQKVKELEKEIKEKETSSGNNESGSSGTKSQIISPKGLFKIDLPQSGDSIASPVRIKGWANVFEAEFQVRIKDASGNVLVTKSVMASEGAPNGGTFDTTIVFTQPSTTQQGTIEIFDLSQMDGSVDDMAKIPVTLKVK